MKVFVPEWITTDIFPNPWLDRRENAYALNFPDESVSTLIFLDVFHHLKYPGTALNEFRRVLSNSALICAYPDAQRAHIATKDALNNEVKLAFGQGDLSWKPNHLRSAYGAICCKRFKPQNMTDDIFLAQILGTNACRGLRPCQSGRVTRISMSWGSEASC